MDSIWVKTDTALISAKQFFIYEQNGEWILDFAKPESEACVLLKKFKTESEARDCMYSIWSAVQHKEWYINLSGRYSR